jgi:transcriptional regulator with XRE-family HTH domain
MNDNDQYNRLTEKEPCIGGFIIRALRKRLGLTYEDMEMLGFGKNTIRNWCQGHTNPQYKNIDLILEYYSLDEREIKREAKELRRDYKRRRFENKTNKRNTAQLG